MIETTGKTAVRYGELDGFVAWLKLQGFEPQVTEANRADLENLGREERLYGALIAGDKILLVQSPGIDRKSPNRFFYIVI